MFKKFYLLAALIICLAVSGAAIALADDEVMVNPIPQPNIRVLISKTAAPVTITASSSFGVWFGGIERLSLEAGAIAKASYSAGRYTITANGTTVVISEPVRFAAEDPTQPLRITSINRTLAGHGKRTYQTYRGIVEYRYSSQSKTQYIINELPIEDYLRGLVETSPGDPTEFLKAAVVAARTYAYKNIAPLSDKHTFDVYATTQDQLYLGYESEARMPEVGQAAEATHGEMVWYNNAPVLTLYFSHSNGKTKSWPGKTRPWLTSVVAKYDKGLRQSGHGYGMSLHDAREWARHDTEVVYTDLLSHYYSSTTVAAVYE
jgi:peptidoglycan hydrolase-like amidase